jgi:hypothetical protein
VHVIREDPSLQTILRAVDPFADFLERGKPMQHTDRAIGLAPGKRVKRMKK